MSCLLRQAESLLLSDKTDGSIYVVQRRPVRPTKRLSCWPRSIKFSGRGVRDSLPCHVEAENDITARWALHSLFAQSYSGHGVTDPICVYVCANPFLRAGLFRVGFHARGEG